MIHTWTWWNGIHAGLSDLSLKRVVGSNPTVHMKHRSPALVRQGIDCSVRLEYCALDGFYKVIRKQEEVLDAPIYLAEDELEKINSIFCTLQDGDEITINYYSNGHHVSKTSQIVHIDNYKKFIKFVDGSCVRFNQITGVCAL